MMMFRLFTTTACLAAVCSLALRAVAAPDFSKLATEKYFPIKFDKVDTTVTRYTSTADATRRTAAYRVDDVGRIITSSIKDQEIAEIANECDKNRDSLLESAELYSFVKRFPILKTSNLYLIIYYEETDSLHNVVKRCTIRRDTERSHDIFISVEIVKYFTEAFVFSIDGDVKKYSRIAQDSHFHLNDFTKGISYFKWDYDDPNEKLDWYETGAFLSWLSKLSAKDVYKDSVEDIYLFLPVKYYYRYKNFIWFMLIGSIIFLMLIMLLMLIGSILSILKNWGCFKNRRRNLNDELEDNEAL